MVMKAEWINSKDLPEGKMKAFAELFSTQREADLIKNVLTKMRFLKVSNNLVFPASINDSEVENTFVCSPFTAYARYSKDELTANISNKWLQYLLLAVIKILAWFLRLGNIDRNVHINNFLLSTNPYPDWDGTQIKSITEFVRREYPNHAIIFRSLNRYQHQTLLDLFEKAGYQKIGSRQVYLFDQDYRTWLKHGNNKHDRRLIKKQGLTYIDHEAMFPYLEEALALYNKLYLIKYSPYNPQFTLTYFQGCHQKNIMYFQGFLDESGNLVAFSGLFIMGNTITSPLVGYDTDAPQKKGYYIHAIHTILQYKFTQELILNLSSGAAHFKRLRGGKPSIEYSVVFTRHLPLRRRIIWFVLQWVSNSIGVPLIKRYKL